LFKNPLGIFIFYLSRDHVLKPGPAVPDDFQHRPFNAKRLDLTPEPAQDPRPARI
jgi:hypothetical protein